MRNANQKRYTTTCLALILSQIRTSSLYPHPSTHSLTFLGARFQLNVIASKTILRLTHLCMYFVHHCLSCFVWAAVAICFRMGGL
jgi:hypothetical protein